MDTLFRISGTAPRDPQVETWLAAHDGPLGQLARVWFETMRRCGSDVREAIHDGCPVACLGDVPFGYVNVFAAHVNVGFYQGSSLPDPAGLLEGAGKRMRHVKLRPGVAVDEAALRRLIEAAWRDIKEKVERG